MKEYKIVYLVEGLNFGYDRSAYETIADAMEDLRIDFPNAGGLEAVPLGRGAAAVTFGNGNVLTITPVRLL